jgi:Sec63 Brl domain
VAHKVTLLVQATLGDAVIPNSPEFKNCRKQYEMDEKVAFSTLERLVRCVIDCQIHLRSGKGTKNALELARSLAARAWEDSPSQMRQIYGVGPVAVKKFIGAKIMSLGDLEAAGPHRINIIMGRNPGFGESLLKNLDGIPKLSLCLRETDFKARGGQNFVLHFTASIAFLNHMIPETFNRKPVFVCFLAERSDGYLVDFRRMPARYAVQNPLHVSANITDLQQLVSCYVMCDDVAGSLRSAELRPKHVPKREETCKNSPEHIYPASSAVEEFMDLQTPLTPSNGHESDVDPELDEILGHLCEGLDSAAPEKSSWFSGSPTIGKQTGSIEAPTRSGPASFTNLEEMSADNPAESNICSLSAGEHLIDTFPGPMKKRPIIFLESDESDDTLTSPQRQKLDDASVNEPKPSSLFLRNERKPRPFKHDLGLSEVEFLQRVQQACDTANHIDPELWDEFKDIIELVEDDI